MKLKKKKVLIVFDRDGTLIHDSGYFGRENDWQKKLKFHTNAIEAIRGLNDLGKVILATNQIGVAYGYFTTERVEEIHRYMDEKFSKQGARIDGWYYSPYVEKSWAEKKGLDLKTPWVLETFPRCRKPNVGMLESAVKNFGGSLQDYKIFVVGDSLEDMNLALNVGGTGIFFQNGKNNKILKKIPQGILIITNLLEIIDIVKKNAG